MLLVAYPFSLEGKDSGFRFLGSRLGSVMS